MTRTNMEVAVLAGRIGLGIALVLIGYPAVFGVIAAWNGEAAGFTYVLLAPDVLAGLLGVALAFGIKLRTVAALVLIFAIYKTSLLFSLIATGLILTAKPGDETSS